MSETRKRQAGVLVQIGKGGKSGDCSLTRRSEFDLLKKSGKKLSAPLMIFIYLDAPDGLMKLGVICGRKFDKSAVRRNRARRLVREAFRLLRNGVVDAHILVIPKKAIMRCKTPQVQEELIRLLIKAGLWKEKQVF